MTAPYTVPKREVRAEVRLSSRAPAVVRLFLSERAERHAGPERPSDLLNGTLAFLPARDDEGQLVLLNRDAIVALRVSAELELDGEAARAEDLAADRMTAVGVEVTLDDGSAIRGTIKYLMPEAQSRLQDFLNTGDQFITLLGEGAAHLVNKRRIASVRPT